MLDIFLAQIYNEARSLGLLKPNSKFKNLDFDAKAALGAAKVYRAYRNLPKNRKSQEPRQKVQVDIQTIGIALANNATAIISHDQGLKIIVNELGLDLDIYDYMDNNYFEQMSIIVVAESDRVQ